MTPEEIEELKAYSRKLNKIIEDMQQKGQIGIQEDLVPLLEKFWTVKNKSNAYPKYSTLSKYINFGKPNRKVEIKNVQKRKMEIILATMAKIQAHFEEKNVAENPVNVPLRKQEYPNTSETQTNQYELDKLRLFEGVFECYSPNKGGKFGVVICKFNDKGEIWYLYAGISHLDITKPNAFLQYLGDGMGYKMISKRFNSNIEWAVDYIKPYTEIYDIPYIHKKINIIEGMYLNAASMLSKSGKSLGTCFFIRVEEKYEELTPKYVHIDEMKSIIANNKPEEQKLREKYKRVLKFFEEEEQELFAVNTYNYHKLNQLANGLQPVHERTEKPAFAKKQQNNLPIEILGYLSGTYECYYLDKDSLIKTVDCFDSNGNVTSKHINDYGMLAYMYSYVETFIRTRTDFKLNILNADGVNYATAYLQIDGSREGNFLNLIGVYIVSGYYFYTNKLVFIENKRNSFDDLSPENVKIGSEKCNEWIEKHPIIKEFLLSDTPKVKHNFTIPDLDFSEPHIKPSLPQNTSYLNYYAGTYYIYRTTSSQMPNLSLYLLKIYANGTISMRGEIDDYRGIAIFFRGSLTAINITDKRDTTIKEDYQPFCSQFIFFSGHTNDPIKTDGILSTVGVNNQPVSFKIVLLRSDFDFDNLRGNHFDFFDTTFDNINKDAEIYRLTPLPPKKEPIKNVGYSLMGKTGNYMEASTNINFQPEAINQYAFMYFSSACYSAQNEGSEAEIFEYLKEAFMHGFCRGKDEQKHKKLLKKEMETGALKDYADLIDFENLCMKS